jgi:lipoprotein NlpI
MLLEPYESRYPGLTRLSPAVINDDVTNNVLTLTSTYGSPKLVVQIGTDWVLRYSPTNFQQMLTRAPAAQRIFPMLAFGAPPHTRSFSIEVEFPSNVAVVTDPQTRSVKDRRFEYGSSVAFRGNRASASAQLTLIEPIVEPKETPAYIDAVRRANELSFSAFVVRRDEIKSSGLFGLGTKDIGATIKGRLEERIKLITTSIDAGKLTGDDLAEAYCDRADAQSDLGQPAQALQDAQNAIKTAPNLPLAYACRGSAYFVQGDFARSIADYSKAITLGDASFNNFYRRGHSRFYANQLAAAQEDFAKAIQASEGDAEGALYARIWSVWTLRRLGQTPPPADARAINSQKTGAWPRPAIALFTDGSTVEDVLAFVDRKRGDEKDMALVEAHFYIGQHFMIKGDKQKAIEHFRKAREKQVTIYIEHVAAGHELKALGVGP